RVLQFGSQIEDLADARSIHGVGTCGDIIIGGAHVSRVGTAHLCVLGQAVGSAHPTASEDVGQRCPSEHYFFFPAGAAALPAAGALPAAAGAAAALPAGAAAPLAGA